MADENHINFRFDGEKLIPLTDSAKEFLSSLPTGIKIPISFYQTEDSARIGLTCEASHVDYETWSFLRSEIAETLRNKTNIPEELIGNWYRGKQNSFNKIAGILRYYLEYVRQTEDTGHGPNVSKTLTRSEISYVATDMLSWALPDESAELLDLLFELLDVDRTYQKHIKYKAPMKRYEAFRLMALYPNLSLRKVAKVLDVSPSTISRWANSDDAEVQLKKAQRSPNNIAEFKARHPEHSDKQLAKHFHVELSYIKQLKQDKLFISVLAALNSRTQSKAT